MTGSVEVVAQKVTDLTGLATGVYDLATDEKVRTEAYTGLLQVKESLGNDPSQFLPILKEVLVNASTGNTTEQWQSINNPDTDTGKKVHLVSRASGNIVMTVIAGATFIKELPEIAEKLTEKIGKVKDVKKVINTITDLVENVVSNRKNIRKVLDAEEGIVYARKYFDKYVTGRSFEDWWDYAKKYDVNDDLNFEVHHVIPVNILKDNKELQKVLLWAEKNNKKFDFNSIDNGIPLQKKKAAIDLNGHTNHPKYDEVIANKIEDIVNNPFADEVEKFNEIQILIKKAKNKLESDVLLGNKDVNQILDF